MLESRSPTPRDSAALAPLPELARAWARGHSVQLYESDAFLCAAVADFVADAARVGQPALLIVTADRRAAIVEQLQARRESAAELERDGLLVTLDALDTLADVIVDGAPDAARFETIVGGALRAIVNNRSYVVVRVYAEVGALLWKAGNAAGAIALEALWNDLSERHAMDLLCAYEIADFAHESATEPFAAVCAQHGQVSPTESYLFAEENDRLRQIALLQQRAAALQDAVRVRAAAADQLAKTIARRKDVEDELQRRERELRDFLENGLEPMHWVGPNGTIVWANRAELDLLGYTRDEYVGRHVAEFHADRAVIDDILARLLRGEELHNVPARLRHKDGSLRRVLISSNVYWQDGKFVHTRCFSRDITAVELR